MDEEGVKRLISSNILGIYDEVPGKFGDYNRDVCFGGKVEPDNSMVLSDKYVDYSQKIYEKLLDEGIRAEIDTRDEKIGYKIREARLEKVPYMLVLGQKEEETGEVAVRSRFAGDEGAKNFDEFVKSIKEEINTKTIREEIPFEDRK